MASYGKCLKNRLTARYPVSHVLIAIAATVILRPASSMAAQTLTPDDVLTVRDHALAQNMPLGIRAGSFLISPGVELKSTYDDNIFRSSTKKKSDLLCEVKPAAAMQSDWARHEVFAGVEGDFGYYHNNSQNNFGDYGAIASGRYDLTEGTSLTAAVSSAKRHVNQGAFDDPGNSGPAVYRVIREELSYAQEIGRMELEFQLANEDISLAQLITYGFPGSSGHSTRDNHIWGGKAAYEYMEGNDVFVSLNYNETDYKLLSGAPRTSEGIDLRGGVEFDTGHNLNGSVYSNYIYRTYENDDSTRDPFVGFNVNWDVTPLATISATLDKSFQNTAVEGAAGVVRTTRKLTTRYRFTPRFTADVTAGLNDEDYVGAEGPLNRDDTLYYGGLGGQYQFTEHMGLRAQYDLQRRDSALAGSDYGDNRIFFSLIYMH